MMFTENPVLYVRSKKTTTGDSRFAYPAHPHGYNFGAFLGSARTIVNYLPEDQEAIKLLSQTEIRYKLIDLTHCPLTTRLKARISRMKTPTFIFKEKKIVGVENIKQALGDFKT